MNQLLHDTFNEVRPTAPESARMRQRILEAFSKQEEVIPMKKKHVKALLIAAIVILALATTAFAYGEQLLNQFAILGGGTFTVYEGGVSLFVDGDKIPYSVEDGRIYFVAEGGHEDITDRCSAETYFTYRKTENGYTQVLIIGGTPEKVGYINYVMKGHEIVASSSEVWEDDPWVQKAARQFGDTNRFFEYDHP